MKTKPISHDMPWWTPFALIGIACFLSAVAVWHLLTEFCGDVVRYIRKGGRP